MVGLNLPLEFNSIVIVCHVTFPWEMWTNVHSLQIEHWPQTEETTPLECFFEPVSLLELCLGALIRMGDSKVALLPTAHPNMKTMPLKLPAKLVAFQPAGESLLSWVVLLIWLGAWPCECWNCLSFQMLVWCLGFSPPSKRECFNSRGNATALVEPDTRNQKGGLLQRLPVYAGAELSYFFLLLLPFIS